MDSYEKQVEERARSRRYQVAQRSTHPASPYQSCAHHAERTIRWSPRPTRSY